MKSFLVANSVVTILPNNDLSQLERGQLVCLNSKGAVVATSADFANAEMVQFVLGLGNGATKTSVWINPRTVKTNVQQYVAPGNYVYTFNNIALPGNLKVGDELVVTISVQDPRFKETYHHNVYDAIYVVSRDGETPATALAGLKKELDRVIARINKVYGANAITTTPVEGTAIVTSLTLTGKTGLFFAANVEGVLQSELEVTAPTSLYGDGTGEAVANMEKFYSVAGDGYNPSLCRPEEWYGNIFTADASKTYKFYKAESKSPQVHEFGMDSEGMITTSIIAFDSEGTSTALDELFQALSAFSECMGDTETGE